MRIFFAFLLLLVVQFKIEAQDVEVIFQTGNRLHSEGKYKEALEYVNKSLSMDSSLYQRYMFKAEIEVKLGMVGDAIRDIGKCIDRCDCPTRKYHVSSYYARRANLYVYKMDFQNAMDDVNKSIEQNANGWEAFNMRSQLFIRQGDFQKALADLDKSVEINDNEATTLILRGRLLTELGDVKGACKDLSTVANWGFDEYQEWINQNCK